MNAIWSFLKHAYVIPTVYKLGDQSYSECLKKLENIDLRIKVTLIYFICQRFLNALPLTSAIFQTQNEFFRCMWGQKWQIEMYLLPWATFP